MSFESSEPSPSDMSSIQSRSVGTASLASNDFESVHASSPSPSSESDAGPAAGVPAVAAVPAVPAPVAPTLDTSEAASEAPAECPACCLPFTDVARKRVGCPSCDAGMCTACVKRYLLGAADGPHCYSCRTEWSAVYVAEHLPASFVLNALNRHTAALDVARERSLLPAAMGRAEDLRRADRIDAEADALAERVAALRREAGTIRGTRTKKEARAFVMPCQREECRGFLTRAYECGLCEARVCRHCLAELSDETRAEAPDAEAPHTCAEGDLETARMIRETTRPCPECGTRISRVDGCDQMWCTACNTAFNYRTGAKITTGRVHNPHYFEWLYRGGRAAPADAVVGECGALDARAVLAGVRAVGKARPRGTKSHVVAALDFVRRIETVLAGRTGPDVSLTSEVEFEEARVEYLRGAKTEAQWTRWVRAHRRRNTYRAEVRAILETYRTVLGDLLRRMGAPETRDDAVVNFLDREASVRAFANDALRRTDALIGYQCAYKLAETRARWDLGRVRYELQRTSRGS